MPHQHPGSNSYQLATNDIGVDDRRRLPVVFALAHDVPGPRGDSLTARLQVRGESAKG